MLVLNLHINIKSLLLIVAIMLFADCKNAHTQVDDASWWNHVHNWDGVTHWSGYIIHSPYYLGPNALPVPFSQKGVIKNRYELKIDVEAYLSSGDKTQDIFLGMYIPVVKNIIAIEFYGVPFEHYNMDENTVYVRRARNRDGEGYAIGDFYFSTIIQLLKDKKIPDIAFRMAFRTTSGSKLSDARFTDAPGYFFDISMGKDYIVNKNFVNRIRLHAMMGFYTWQTNLSSNKQDDAFLFGLGIDLFLKKYTISNAIDGYIGYVGNRQIRVVKEAPLAYNDRPVVYRLDVSKAAKLLDVGIGYQLGLHNFNYQCLKFSLLFHLDKITCNKQPFVKNRHIK